MKSVKIINERGRGRPRKGEEHSSEELLAAALKNFAEMGFDKASMRAIASDAGVDVALISYRFGSKLGLWTTIIENVGEETVEETRQSIKEAARFPAGEAQNYLWQRIVDQICRRPHFSQLLVSEVVTNADPQRVAIIADKLARPVFETLRPFLHANKSSSSIANIDPGLAVFATISMVGLMSSTPGFLAIVTGESKDEKILKDELKILVTRLWS